MNFKTNCQICGGLGVLLDPDPIQPARLCKCLRQLKVDLLLKGIPNRYRGASIDSFWDWWEVQHPINQISKDVIRAYKTLEYIKSKHKLKPSLSKYDTNMQQNLVSSLELIIHQCGLQRSDRGDIIWNDLKPAQEPQGYRSILYWARNGYSSSNFWWIDGAPSSGRSTLAAAILKAWCKSTGKIGLFTSIRTLSAELKDIRNFRNNNYISDRDRLAPILKAPCLVLDDFDRMDSDIRVVQSIAQLLDYRYGEELPTIITAITGAESLRKTNSDIYPLLRLEDHSILQRLSAGKRVVLEANLARILSKHSGLSKILENLY